MTIAINTRFLLPNKLEGIGWFTYEVVRRLVERHPEHHFVFLFDRPYDERFVFAENVEPIVVSPPARHPVLWYLWFEWAVPSVLRKVKADLFFSSDSYCSLRSKVPTVMVTHDIAHVHFPDQIPRLVRTYYDYFVPRYLKRAEHIITVSEYSKQDMIAHYGIPKEKISVACNGSRAHIAPVSEVERRRTQAQYANANPYFFYLGALHPRKNLPRLIQAFDQFKAKTQSDVQLLIGGRFAWQTGPIKAAYDAAIHKDSIHFLGYIDDSDLPTIMGSALALTYVSLFEGFGMPLLEALHCEVPIICSNVSSMPEVVGGAGILVDPTDVTDIANAMEQVWRKPEVDKAKYAEQRARFTWERAVEVIEGVML